MTPASEAIVRVLDFVTNHPKSFRASSGKEHHCRIKIEDAEFLDTAKKPIPASTRPKRKSPCNFQERARAFTTSEHVYFANDHLAVRFIKEIDFDYMATAAS